MGSSPCRCDLYPDVCLVSFNDLAGWWVPCSCSCVPVKVSCFCLLTAASLIPASPCHKPFFVLHMSRLIPAASIFTAMHGFKLRCIHRCNCSVLHPMTNLLPVTKLVPVTSSQVAVSATRYHQLTFAQRACTPHHCYGTT